MIQSHSQVVICKYSRLLLYRWNEIIGQSTELVKKLPLILQFTPNRPDWLHVFEQTKDFSRKYYRILISGCDFWDNNTLKVFRKFGSNLRVLELFSCGLGDQHVEIFNNLFSNLNKLESLCLILVRTTGNLRNLLPHCLPRLRTVALTSTWYKVFSFQHDHPRSLKLFLFTDS